MSRSTKSQDLVAKREAGESRYCAKFRRCPRNCKQRVAPAFTSLMRFTPWEDRERRRPASQETCRDTKKRPRAGCPGGRLQIHAGVCCRAFDAASPKTSSLNKNTTGSADVQIFRSPARETKAAPVFQLGPESLAAPEEGLTHAGDPPQRHVSKFDASKISVAMTKAFLAVEGHTAAASRRVHEVVEKL